MKYMLKNGGNEDSIMNKAFEYQIRNSVPLTEEVIDTLFEKEYFNGDNIEVGDKLLFAFNAGDTTEIIKLNEKHFDMFELLIISEIPKIKLKNEPTNI
jgi:hypothetical protein